MMLETPQAPPEEAANEESFLFYLEHHPEDVEQLFAITRALKKRGEKEKPRALLQKLAAAQKSKGLAIPLLETTIELARSAPNKAASPAEVADLFREAYIDHPEIENLVTYYFGPKANVVEAAEKLRRWLPFPPGAVFFFPGRGAGRVSEIRPAIESVKLELESGQKISIPPGAASRTLVPLPEGDFRRERLEDRAGFAARVVTDAPAALKHLIESVGRPQTLSEIKDAFEGLVPAEKWTSFWAAARKHPNVVLKGTGKNATYGWGASAEAATDAVRGEFDKAVPARRLEIARKEIRRSGLADHFAAKLAEDARSLSQSAPSLALEIAFFLEDGPGASPVVPADLLRGPRAIEIARNVADPSSRLRAYRIIREARPDVWSDDYAALFEREEDSRVLAFLDTALAEGAPEKRQALADKIFRSPKVAPRAFLWLCEKRTELPHVEKRMTPALLIPLLDALRAPEFSAHRAKVKALFDRGGLALELAAKLPDAEEGRRIITAADRASGLESFRRDDLKQTILRKFTELAGPKVEPLYATAASIAEKRIELDQLLTVDLPKNGRAIQEAAQMGDLRENFEYHAARSRQEFLSARAAGLRKDLARARTVDPATVDTTEIRVGTQVTVSSGKARRTVTILGPWESRPEAEIYSYESDFAKALLGRKVGDEVAVAESPWRVEEIKAFSLAPAK